MRVGPEQFSKVWLVDFEFSALPGERPQPVCLVAWELHSGRKLRVWQDELLAMPAPPYSVAANSLFVAYYASAEMGCHLALGWELPVNLLDLFTEFRNRTNGLALPCGNGLLGALAWFGLDCIQALEKESMCQLALRGGPWTMDERAALLDYCESDVDALAKLLVKMADGIDLPRALLRGRYMKAAAFIETTGTPIDTEALASLRQHWTGIQDDLIQQIDADYQVFEGRSFKAVRFNDYLIRNSIPWPQLPSGGLDLSDDVFKEMAKCHPQIAPLRELRVALSQMRLKDLAVGQDGRNRCLLSAFQAKTGRNQPSTSRFIFGPSVWLRGLIRPEPGYGLAYIDWSQQEFGIAAALSGDARMQEAYESGDPYLAFAKQAGTVPAAGTKDSHPQEREQFKSCVLAVQYGMGEVSLAARIGKPPSFARELLRMHRETYRTFWRWSDGMENYALLHGRLFTTFGWQVHTGSKPNPRSLRNFPMQANGAEMLRLACCFAVERGVRVCAPVHDAILIEAPLGELDGAVRTAQQAMAEASHNVLDGLRLRSDTKIVRYPERYADPRGSKMWNTVWDIIDCINGRQSG